MKGININLRALRNVKAMAAGFSTAPAASTKKLLEEFVVNRKKFNNELKEIRGGWRAELKVKKEEQETQRAVERKRIVLEKAQKDRVKAELSAIRQAQDRERKEKARQRFREHLAHNVVEYRARVAKQTKRYDKYFEDVEKECEAWITPQNIDSKITEDLFLAPSSTGHVVGTSHLWTVHAMSVCLERVVSKDYLDSFEGSSMSAMMHGQQEFTRKAEVRAFLEQMVSNGKEREQMNELVEKFSKEFDVVGGFDDNKLYFEYMLEKADGAAPGTVMNFKEFADYGSLSADDKKDLPEMMSKFDDFEESNSNDSDLLEPPSANEKENEEDETTSAYPIIGGAAAAAAKKKAAATGKKGKAVQAKKK